MSYLDKIIETDGWGDKKNSKIFEMMKHNQEKFGHNKARVLQPSAKPEKESEEAARPPEVTVPYEPFKAKHEQ
jgi:hypothetical protein